MVMPTNNQPASVRARRAERLNRNSFILRGHLAMRPGDVGHVSGKIGGPPFIAVIRLLPLVSRSQVTTHNA